MLGYSNKMDGPRQSERLINKAKLKLVRQRKAETSRRRQAIRERKKQEDADRKKEAKKRRKLNDIRKARVAARRVVESDRRKKVAKRARAFQRVLERRRTRYKTYIRLLANGTIDKYTFIPRNFKDVIDGLYATGSQFVLSVGDSEYTLNEANYQRLRGYLNPDGTIIDADVFESGSDEVLLQTITKVPSFTVSRLVPRPRAITPRGSFFPWTHLMEGVDLSCLQIYLYDCYDYDLVNNENCFITALKSAGIETENGIQQMCRGREMPQKVIKQVAEAHNLYITVKSPGGSTAKRTYGKKTDSPIQLGLMSNHYFHIKPIPVTSWAMKNYNSIKDRKNWHTFVSNDKRKNNRFISSYDVVKLLLEHKDDLLVELERETIIKTIYQDKKKNIDSIIIRPTDIAVNKPVKEREVMEEWQNVFFDFETTTQGRHIPYLCRCDVINKVWVGKDCGKKMLNDLVRRFPGKCLRLFAHNAGYDIKFIFGYLGKVKVIERGKSLLRATAGFYKTDIIVQDTYAHIAMPLRKFGNVFKIPVSKEIIPYDLYTEENVAKRFIRMEECLAGVDIQYRKNNIGKPKITKDLEELRTLFENNCTKWVCVVNGWVDIIKYSSMYCKMDCEVLKQGYNKFRGWMLEITDLDIDNYVSLPSVANDGFNDCFEGVYRTKGIVREFIFQAMVGGRTMMRANKKSHKQLVLDDFDAVSLYPSAMARLGGYLLGKPKMLGVPQMNMDFLNSVDGYVVDIKITKVGKDQKFPLLSDINDGGIRVFNNDMVGKVKTVDKISLEDLVQFQEVEFELIRGYYWDEGRNMKLKTKIEYFFGERVKKKAEKNPIESVYKLLMNSAYGKTLLKPFETDNKIIPDKQKDDFVARHYNQISEMASLHNGSHKIKVYNTIDEHFNNAICGVEVLAMSKRIMNEVMCLAEDLGMKIYYQDTDSLHIPRADISGLASAFREKYGRDLIGKGMGQFHSDFNSDVIKKDIKAVESVFVGKKCYIDKLEGLDANGEVVNDYHIRMKGCSNESILWWCEQNNQTPMDLYKRLFAGEKIELDQTCGGEKICFDYTKDYWVKTKEKFSRAITFA